MASTHELITDVLAALGPDGVMSEYEACGVHIASKKPNPSGWVSAHAIDRADKKPSVGINIINGWYKDHGGGGETMGLLDFLVKYGQDQAGVRLKDWKDALTYLAKKTGLSRRLPKKWENQDARPQDKFRFWTDSASRDPVFLSGFLKRYPRVTHQAILDCGGRIADYPPRGPNSFPAIVFPAVGAQVDAPPRAFVAMAANGKKIQVFRGEGNPPDYLDKMVVGASSGLVGTHGLSRLKTAELIFKVEGISDMLALQSFIPDQYRDKHVVVTNACGASEVSLPSEVSPAFVDCNVVICHDCDRPGQDGAQHWIGALAGMAGSVKNLVLPYPVEDKRGKDLRDWIDEGHSYAEFLALVDATPQESMCAPGGKGLSHTTTPNAPHAHLTDEQNLLKRLGISVIGETEDNTIVAFSQHLGKHVRIRGLRNYSYPEIIQNFGEVNKKEVQAPGAEMIAGQCTVNNVRAALAAEAGKYRITDDNLLGRGVWLLSGRLVLVNSGHSAIANGKLAMSKSPSIDNKPIDFTGGNPWFDFDRLSALFDQAGDPATGDAWCKAVFDEAVALFSRWNNWHDTNSPELLASLVACSWVQTCWDLRPMVYVIGPTNCGKSMLMKAIAEMFGALRFDTDQPTAAGIRQTIRHTAQILLVDEFERCDERQKILAMLRSSSRGGVIVKGTPGQRAQNYVVKHIVWLSSIESGMREAADLNRYIMLELDGLVRGAARTLVVPPVSYLRDLGQKLLAVALRKFPMANPLAVRLGKMGFAGVESRVVEIYAVPVAMIGTILGWDEAACRAYMEQVFHGHRLDFSIEDDEHELIQTIFEAVVPLPRGGRATVGQLLEWPTHDTRLGDDTPADILERSGIREVEVDGRDGLFFAPNMIRQLLRTEMNISQLLGRCSGASRGVRIYMNKVRTRGIFVPMSTIESIGAASGDDAAAVVAPRATERPSTELVFGDDF